MTCHWSLILIDLYILTFGRFYIKLAKKKLTTLAIDEHMVLIEQQQSQLVTHSYHWQKLKNLH